MPRATDQARKDQPPSRAKRPAPKRRKRSATAKDEVHLTGDRLVVARPDGGERTSRGGLLIPATATAAPKRCEWGEVSLVGPDVRAVKRGDRVLFLPQSGLEVELGGEDYLLLRERDVQAIATAEDGKGRDPGQYL